LVDQTRKAVMIDRPRPCGAGPSALRKPRLL